MKVEGGDAVKADIEARRRRVFNRAYRWLIAAANIVRYQSQWWIRKGQPGFYTGTIHNSIGFQAKGTPQGDVKFVAEIGPGLDSKRPLNEKERLYAFYIHQGFRRHFVPYAGNELLQLWARQHGLIKGPIRTGKGGGLMVGGPNSATGRGLQYMFKGWLSSQSKLEQSFQKMKSEIASDLR